MDGGAEEEGVPFAVGLPLAAICLASGAAVSVGLGQDANWDLLNYHLSNAYAALNGRMAIDLAPSGLQSYFNPTLDLPFYVLATGPLSMHPRLLAGLMGLPFGGLGFIAFCVAWRLMPGFGSAVRGGLAAITALAAVTGAASLCQAGTVFNEVTIAMLVLWGVLLVLARADTWNAWPGIAAGGALFGAAAGLKLTAVVFAPALCLAVLVRALCARRVAVGVGVCAVFTAAWVAAFLPLAGWWGWQVFERFGNPSFPLFNSIFRSPWFAPIDFYDLRFLPASPWQWAFYPFWWAFAADRPVNAELAYRDPRLALALMSAVVMACVAAWRRNPWTRGQLLVLLFWVPGYAGWLKSSAIMRYGIVLEVLGTILAMVLVVRLCTRVPIRFRAPATLSVVCAVAGFCIAWTKPPDYGRVAYGPRTFDVDMSWTPPGTLFVAITGPSAYVTAFVPAGAHARTVGFSFLNRLAGEARLNTETAAMIRSNEGPVYVLVPDGGEMVPYLPLIGVSTTLGPCRAIRSNLDGNRTRACEATRL